MTTRRLQLCFVALALLACGGGGAEPTPPAEVSMAGAPQTGIASTVNVCPRFQGVVLQPQRIAPGERAYISVDASDPDGPTAALTFSWTARSGTFGTSDESMTSYQCDDLGPQSLTVSATDLLGCKSLFQILVECVAE